MNLLFSIIIPIYNRGYIIFVKSAGEIQDKVISEYVRKQR